MEPTKCSWPCILRHLHVVNINDAIKAWHGGAGSNKSLHEFLGMPWEVYKEFAMGKMTESQLAIWNWYEE